MEPPSARFQSFENKTDPAQAAPRLAALRAELARRGLDGFLVPRADEHQGEYVPARAERLAWLTGFTGSAGVALALRDRAAVFVDGRYTLQVREQVDTKLFTPVHLIERPPHEWMRAELRAGERVGYDPWLHTPSEVDRLRAAAHAAGAELVACEGNPLDAAWGAAQPAVPLAPLEVHPLEHAGEAPDAKRARVAAAVREAGADAAVLTLPESIAWLLNVRGGDVRHTPLPLAFALLAASGEVELFVDERKLTPAARAHLGAAVRARPPAEFAAALEALGRDGRRVMVDPSTAASWVLDRLAAAGARVHRAADPCLLPKACKNAAEVAGARRAHARDGAALSRFLAWVKREGPSGRIDEVAACVRLEALRAESGALRDLSFDTIAGAGPNGAIVHYRATRQTSRPLREGELFLIDSGAQYPDGTTDVTRTVAIGGAPTAEQRDRFTRVLKGHVALARAVFPEGTLGLQLDALARLPLWEAGLDYDHGTGHGVGSYLSVHEGPQSISKRLIIQPLRAGMICSNEPGYYKTGEYGIRIENLVVVQPAEVAGAERAMLCFETLTLAPIDLDLVEPALLAPEERRWLDAYHARVRDAIAPMVDGETAAWLARATRAL